MVWNIVTDSSCDLRDLELPEGSIDIRYYTVPFIISVDNVDYVDDDDVNVSGMLEAMENSRQASHTSCPSPHVWEEAFRREGNVIAITISKELSGSYNSACVAKDTVMDEIPDKQIAVVNSASTGPAIISLIQMLVEEINAGRTFAEVTEKAEQIIAQTKTIFALCSFDNLVKAGRMSKLSGFIARTLGFWGIGIASPEGRIVIKGKERVTKKVLAAFMADIKERGGITRHMVISHCENEEMALRIQETVLVEYPDVIITIFPTRALDSYYAERHGLIIAYY